MLNVIYAECRTQTQYTEYRYAECRYAEYRYAECHGAMLSAFSTFIRLRWKWLTVRNTLAYYNVFVLNTFLVGHKTFSLSLTQPSNKLECLSLKNFYSLV
jgi:hypothetical protein